MSATGQQRIKKRSVGDNVWLAHDIQPGGELLAKLQPGRLKYEVLSSEDAVGRAMLERLKPQQTVRLVPW